MKKYQDMVNSSASIQGLCDTLNAIPDELAGDWETIDQYVSLSDLPTFGGPDPENTSEVWSWDSENYLSGENEWVVRPRCKTCGEAPFHCHHDQEN
jgi:hypothetical protein